MSEFIETGDKMCPKCDGETREQRCDSCEDGFEDHDCGEDCCCCLDPEPNVSCGDCGGGGWHHWCSTCGWDLISKQYINGVDERVGKQYATAMIEITPQE